MPTEPGSEVPRSLTDQLRGWSDDELAELLRSRPDLATPAPQDTSQLASRAVTRPSVLRALDQLTRPELATLEALLVLGTGAAVAGVQRLVNAEPGSVARAVDRLRALALVWGSAECLRPVTVLGELLPARVTGTGEPARELLAAYGPGRLARLARDLGLGSSGDREGDLATVAGHLAAPGTVDALVADLPEEARALLDRLEEGGNQGTVSGADREVSRAAATTPVEHLLARGLLLAVDRRNVAVPAEVVIAGRGGRTTRDPVDVAPPLATSARSAGTVDTVAAGAAHELVRHTTLLLEHWGTRPPAVLRSGGLGVRDLRAAAELLQVDPSAAALHVEVAHAAGLLAPGSTEDVEAAWLPTDSFDLWSTRPVSERWAGLALAWLDGPRMVGLVGGRDEADRRVNALVDGLERGWLVEERRTALGELARLGRGEVLASGTGVASVVELLRWRRPRRPAERADAVAWALAEAATLGVTGLGGLAPHGRALLGEGAAGAAEALAPLLPEPVDHVLIQADLTAVAPGPLDQELEARLASLADVESRGGATVYRFTESSLRHGFDAGWSVAEVHAFLTSVSRTPVPQPLSYLVDDVSRRFGTLRAGLAAAFLRSDDETALTELLHHPRATSLGLRRIAPTVVVSEVSLDVLLPRLREIRAAPVVEAADGTVQLARRESHRSRPPRRRTGPGRDEARASARVAPVVTALRAGDRARRQRPTRTPAGSGERPSPARLQAMLREAAQAGESVWLSYVDGSGSSIERVVDPVHVHSGQLSAYDHRSAEVRLFAIHRIVAVQSASATG